MDAASLDDFLVRHAPGPVAAVAPGLLEARARMRAALGTLAAIEDAALEKPWPWRGEEADVRYGLYRQYEALEEARDGVARLLAPRAGAEPPARAMLAAATAARWDVHGVIATLDEADLDRAPGGAEWTLRQTLGHIVGGQRGYNWGSTWWLSRRDAPADEFPKYIPEDVSSGMPHEEAEGSGSLSEIGARLDDVLDQGARLFAGLGEQDLGVRARWSGIAVDVRFRLWRWASHIREHTVQLDKTLAMLERPTSEAGRVTRLVAAAYGRLEGEAFMRPAGDEQRRAVEAVAQAAARVASDADEIAASAR